MNFNPIDLSQYVEVRTIDGSLDYIHPSELLAIQDGKDGVIVSIRRRTGFSSEELRLPRTDESVGALKRLLRQE